MKTFPAFSVAITIKPPSSNTNQSYILATPSLCARGPGQAAAAGEDLIGARRFTTTVPSEPCVLEMALSEVGVAACTCS